RQVNLGQYLNAGEAIATLTDLDTLYANFTLPQKYLGQLRAGEVEIRQVNLGQYLNAGEAIATLTDLDTLYANFTLPQKYLGQLRAG
ncbi:HlyD family efflux transporter periplasmic adaptor subunit, partial [Burkholderia gladioli]|uniref:HlyD family efflux transporter periplasmic adaptor subunit n=1 Tax=Burkholderia gladioli TaxID=28095 RepID=UPI00163F2C3F